MEAEGKYILKFVKESWYLGDLPFDGWYLEGGNNSYWGEDGLNLEPEEMYDLSDFGTLYPYNTNYAGYFLSFAEAFDRWLRGAKYPPVVFRGCKVFLLKGGILTEVE